jgi:hypothetical protein
MTAEKRRTEPEFLNPRYAGATPEQVGRTLLRHELAADGGEANSNPGVAADEPDVRSDI